MAVIPFPIRVRSVPSDELGQQSLLRVIAAIQSLGEPATLAEIGNLLLASRAVQTQYEVAALSSILALYSRPDGTETYPFPLFRLVQIGGLPAWAFTSLLRRELRARGIEPKLRADA